MFSLSFFHWPLFKDGDKLKETFVFIILFFIMEWIGREKKHPFEKFGLIRSRPVRWSMYMVLILIILIYGGKGNQFIYFQF